MKPCIIRDGTTKKWVLKTAEGKRLPLRAIRPDDPQGVKPDDVVDLARQTGHFGTQQTTPLATSEAKVPGILAPGDQPIVAFVAYYRGSYAIGHRPTSVKRVGGILDQFVAFLSAYNAQATEPITMLSGISPATINAYFHWRIRQTDKRIRKGLQPHVCVTEISQLSGLFTLAVDEDRILTNPCKRPLKRLRKLHPQPDKIKALSPDQTQDLLGKVAAEESSGKLPTDYADCIRLALLTGMRREAIVHLDFSWVDDQYIIHIPPSGAVATKTPVGYQAVIAPEGRAIIDRRRKSLGSGRVFPSVTSHSFYDRLRRIGKGVHPHMLRHTLATTGVDLGIPLQVIGDQLGQRDYKVTQRYARVRQSAKVEALNKFTFGVQTTN